MEEGRGGGMKGYESGRQVKGRKKERRKGRWVKGMEKRDAWRKGEGSTYGQASRREKEGKKERKVDKWSGRSRLGWKI